MEGGERHEAGCPRVSGESVVPQSLGVLFQASRTTTCVLVLCYLSKVTRVPVLRVQSFRLLLPLGLAGLSPFRPPGAVGTGGTQSFQAPLYPGDWRDSVFSAPRVAWGPAGLSHFRPPCTLGTGGTQSFQPLRYPVDWRDSVLSGPLCTGETQSSYPPTYPGDWWTQSFQAPKYPETQYFSSPNTLRTESSQKNWYWRVM